MPTATETQRDNERKREVAQIKAQIKRLLDAAVHAELAMGFVSTLFWKEVLEPMLVEDARNFHADVWNCKEEDFPKLRAAALRSREIHEAILTMPTKQDEYKKEAERLSEVLQSAIEDGRAKPEDLNVDETP